jgi:hypothetical protein
MVLIYVIKIKTDAKITKVRLGMLRNTDRGFAKKKKTATKNVPTKNIKRKNFKYKDFALLLSSVEKYPPPKVTIVGEILAAGIDSRATTEKRLVIIP